ncbi:polysaccharide deacetylase family protein, partial [Clostridium sp.]
MRKFSNKKLQNIILIALIIILVGVIFAIYIREKEEKNIASNENIEDLQLNEEQEEPKIEPVEINRFEGLTLINDNRGVPVLYYHSVEPSEKNEVIISPDRLREQLQFIKDSGYTTLTISEFNDYIINKKSIPEKSILITFDDGYMDNYTNAFPILKELDMKATIFVITSVIDEGSYYLSSERIKEMSDYGIDIESHTA